jgi:hypothetical protein
MGIITPLPVHTLSRRAQGKVEVYIISKNAGPCASVLTRLSAVFVNVYVMIPTQHKNNAICSTASLLKSREVPKSAVELQAALRFNAERSCQAVKRINIARFGTEFPTGHEPPGPLHDISAP